MGPVPLATTKGNRLMMIYSSYILAAIFISGWILFALSYRVVVSTNAVHIVQSGSKTVSYGKGAAAGNTYYKWPAWLPFIGIRVIQMPVSIFDVQLSNYNAYDKGRVPFVIDIMAFFRITDSNLAAARVSSFQELEGQLQAILQSACRSILASSEIEEILEGRSGFGELFTKEVDHNLENWGLQSVKQIELMDIRDVSGGKVIENIMMKKKSLIEKESRVAVAENQRAAQVAEIEAQQAVKVREQSALLQIGTSTAEKDQQIGIANQRAQQAVKEEERATAVKQMAVVEVNNVRQAEITRSVQLVAADQGKQIAIVNAEGTKQSRIITAEGELAHAQLNAQGFRAEGEAHGAAETATLMAPVNSQIALAKEIGGNAGYQTYLLSVRTIEKDQAVGVAQAAALTQADVKIIANTGNAVEGVKSAMDLFTSRGGTQLGAMVEALANTPTGAAIVEKLTSNGKHP